MRIGMRADNILTLWDAVDINRKKASTQPGEMAPEALAADSFTMAMNRAVLEDQLPVAPGGATAVVSAEAEPHRARPVNMLRELDLASRQRSI